MLLARANIDATVGMIFVIRPFSTSPGFQCPQVATDILRALLAEYLSGLFPQVNWLLYYPT